MKIKKAIKVIKGSEFILINPEYDIPLEVLCNVFGPNTIKINFLGNGLFSVEGMFGNENKLESLDELTTLDWKDIELN